MKCNKEFLSLNKKELITISNKLWKESIKDYVITDKDFNEINEHKILDKYKDKMKYRRLHSKITADLCGKMFEITKSNFIKKDEYSYWFNIFYLAALTHDVKKFTKNHSRAGAAWMESNLKLEPEYFDSDICDNICDLIRYHKAKEDDILEIQNKKPEIKILIIFIRLADKLSKLVEDGKFSTIEKSEADNKVKALRENSEKLIYDKEFLCNDVYITEKLINDIMNNFKSCYCDKDIMPLI